MGFLLLSFSTLLVGFLLSKYFAGKPWLAVAWIFLLSGLTFFPNIPITKQGLDWAPSEFVFVLLWIGVLMKYTVQRHIIQFSKIRKLIPDFFWVFLFIAVAFLSWWVNNVFDNSEVLEGAVEIAKYIYGVALAWTVVYWMDDWQKWMTSIKFWIVGTSIVTLVSFFPLFGISLPWVSDYRISGTFEKVNQVHSYVVPILPIILWLSARPRSSLLGRLTFFTLSALVIISLLFTGSRTTLLLLVVITLGLAIYIFATYWYRAIKVSFLTFGLAFVLGFTGYVEYRVLRNPPKWIPHKFVYALERPAILIKLSFQRKFEDPRIKQLRIVQKEWANYLVLGVGPHRFQKKFSIHNEVHNTFLGVLIEDGIFALVLLSLWLFQVLRRTVHTMQLHIQSTQKTLFFLVFLGFCSLLVYGMVMFGLRQRVFWLSAGLLISGAHLLLHHETLKEN